MNLSRRELLVAIAMLGLSACSSKSKASDPDESDKEKTEQTPEKQEDETQKEGSQKEEKADDKPEESTKETEAVYDEDKLLAVFRCDIRHGVFGDWEGHTADTTDFSDSYAQVSADGNLNFHINGVTFNGKCALGEETTTQYGGQSDYPARRVLINGEKYATVGSVDFEAFRVDDYLLVDMTTQEDTPEHKGIVFANFYLWDESAFAEE